MKKVNKIITILISGVLLFGLTTSIVSAQTMQERDAAARQKYQTAWELYQKEVRFYKDARQDFLTARAALQKTPNNDNRKAYEEAARTFLEKAVTSLIRRLEAMRNWVENRGALSETEKNKIVAEIDQDIAWLNEQLPKIQNASPEQIKEEATIVKDYWKSHQADVKRIIGQVWAYRLTFVIDKAEIFSETLSDKIAELEGAGKDTTALEKALADFNEKLTLAEEQLELAKQKFGAISSLADADQFFQAGHQYILKANQYLRDAHAILVQIVKDMQTIGAE